MNQVELQEKIAELEKRENRGKSLLEQGFEQFTDDLKPSHIARHALQSAIVKAKSAWSNIFKRGKAEI
jgi:hypothetical protein